MRQRITPEDARDGRIRVPIAVARDNQPDEPIEYWGLEVRTRNLPDGWRLGRWDARVGILDSAGGQVWFAPNDTGNGGETLNPSIINEGETVKVRIQANRAGIVTPLSVSIEGHSGQNHPDITGVPYNVTLRENGESVDMEITVTDDDIGEHDETYTLVINQGDDWQDYHGRRIDLARSRYTFTIPANDGIARGGGFAQLSEWALSGERRGVLAQTSSTTTEGGVVQGAVVLSRAAPEPDGLNVILKVEPGHEGDVFLTNVESARSSLAAGDVPGEYRFNVKSGKVDSADNLAALFNIHVVDDTIVEEVEEVEINILPGPGVPGHWTVRGEMPYRLTIPADASDTDSHTIAWETTTSILDEDATVAADGITLKLLIDDPLASNTVVGMNVSDTIIVADVTNGTYNADAHTLAIDANASEVTLMIVSVGDVTGHTPAVIEIAELVGARVLPAGWSVGEGVHTVTIEDNDRILRFARSEVPSIREGEIDTVYLLVSPPLLSADISIPLLLVGDADAYSLPNASNFTSSTEEGEERNAMATITSDSSRETEFIPLALGALEDIDALDETVMVMIDENNLPEGYTLGAPSIATFTIIDNERFVTFIGEDGRTEENSGQSVSIDVQISPPLDRGQSVEIPLKVAGDADAYTLTVAATNGGTPSPLDGPMPAITFEDGGPDSFTLTLTPPFNDNDLVFDVVNVEIDRDRLPRGFTAGDKFSWRVEIPDDQKHAVSFEKDDIVGYEASAGRIGDVRIFVHPPFPPGMSLGFEMRVPGRARWRNRTGCPGCSLVEIILEEVNTGGDAVQTRGWFWTGSPNYLWVYWITKHDKDRSPETITMTITHAPHPLKIGKIPAYTLFIHDDD